MVYDKQCDSIFQIMIYGRHIQHSCVYSADVCYALHLSDSLDAKPTSKELAA